MVLAVVGHYRPCTFADRAMEALALPANAVVGAAWAMRGRAGKPDDIDMPVQLPQSTLADIRAVVDELLPDAQLSRGLFWRYLLWRRRPLSL